MWQAMQLLLSASTTSCAVGDGVGSISGGSDGAGAAAVGVPASRWLVACTFTLCMFLGFGKRRCELAQMEGAEGTARAADHRGTLAGYSLPLLDQLLSISAAAAIVSSRLDSVRAADEIWLW